MLEHTYTPSHTHIHTHISTSVAKLQASDRQKLLELETRMANRVIGQPDAGMFVCLGGEVGGEEGSVRELDLKTRFAN